MICHDPMSNLFIAVCAECGGRLHVDSDSGFGAASQVSRAGWTLGLRDLCRDCSKAPVPAGRRRARTA